MDLLDDETLLDLRRRAARTDPAAVIAEERARQQAAATAPASTSNGALRDRQQGATRPAADGTAGGRSLCPLCNARPAKHLCNSCQRVVCPADVWTMLGLCKACASAQDVAHWHKPAAPEASNWLGGQR